MLCLTYLILSCTFQAWLSKSKQLIADECLIQLIVYVIWSADYFHYQVNWLFTLLIQLIIYIIKSADYFHYQVNWLFTLLIQLIIYIIKSVDCLHYLVSWLFTLSSQLIIYIIKSADYLHYQVSWLFTWSSQLIIYIITDWFDEYFRLQLLVVPAHLRWWEWDLPIPQWSKLCLILSKRLE